MKHDYQITGMHCGSCKSKAIEALGAIDEVTEVKIELADGAATLAMKQQLPLEALQQALIDADLSYKIYLPGTAPACELHKPTEPVLNGNGIFYCPMHCEGDKTYNKPGDCPVCGMDLLEQPSMQPITRYTCPEHPEINQDKNGDCPLCGMALVIRQAGESAEQKTYRELVTKMKVATGFSLPVFIIAMGEMIPGNPLPGLLPQDYWNWLQLLLTLPVVFYACRMFFTRAWQSIITGNLNMFTLVGIGTGVAFAFSVVGLLFPAAFPDEFKTHSGSVHLYFEATAVILTLVLLGQLLEAKAHSQTSGAIKSLLNLAPSETTLVEHGEDKLIAIQAVKVGDLLRVKPGEKIPVDGQLSEGSSRIDESMITGEPMPVSKAAGDALIAGTINGTQSFIMRAQKVGSDTLLSQIIQMVNNASRSRAPIQRLADSIANYFVPTVIAIAGITFLCWAMLGPEPALVYGFVNAVAVLIIACPCALGLATPMSVMVGIGKGAQSGVLIKNAQALEILNKIDVLITDKTGTLTEGKPSVSQVYTNNPADENTLLALMASLSQHSEHPLSAAIVQTASDRSLTLPESFDFETVAGKGITGRSGNQALAMGNQRLFDQLSIPISDRLVQAAEELQKQGSTVSYIARDDIAEGFIAITDAIKPSSYAVVKALKAQGVEVIMMTGDNTNTAAAVATALAMENFEADCLPADKLHRVKELQNNGKVVAMTGDGINDSPALAQADIGIAMGTGTDVAMESAEITLVNGDLSGVLKALQLSHAVLTNIKQNLFFAFIYNSLGVPVAAGALYPVFGILLSPMIAAAAMSFSSVSVITNSLRLRKLQLK